MIRRCHGGRAQLFIQPIGKQRIELDAQQPALGQQRPMLLDDRKEMRNQPRTRKHHRLAKQRTALGTANIKRIAQRGQIGQAHVVFRTGQRIGQPRAIDIEQNMMRPAYAADLRQLRARIQRSILRGLRQVRHTGHDHMITIRVVCIIAKQLFNLLRGDFAIFVRQRQHLMPTKLNRPSLVHADMPSFSGGYALIALQQAVDHSGVGLRAADKEKDLPLRRMTDAADFSLRRLAVGIRAVAGRFLKIGFHQALHNQWVRAFHIVACKGYALHALTPR